MLQLRKGHEEAMQAYAVEQYVDRTLEQFQKFFPRHCEINGEEPMREMIRLGVDRARKHEITAERNAVLYTTMMLLFGSYFDEDPLTPWAKMVLEAPAIKQENERAQRIYEIGEAHWQRIAGSENQDFLKALRNLHELDPDAIAGTPKQRWPDALQRAFPAHCAAAGKEGLPHIVRLAEKCAAEHQLATDRARFTFAALMVMLGCRFHRDPMYPWASECVGDSRDDEAEPQEIDVDARVDDLLARTRAYAEAWLEALQEEV